MLFSSWENLGRVLVTGFLAYVGLVVLLRLSGKRTLSKMNAFDMVVTIALGSTLATALLPSSVSLADGLLALALLVGLQFGVAWLQVRSRAFRRLVKNEPVVLLRRGELLHDALKRERVARDEVLAAVRSAGIASTDDVFAVVLETDGSLSVIQGAPAGAPSAIENVSGFRPSDNPPPGSGSGRS